MDIAILLFSAVIAFVFGTLLEYVIHRLMHWGFIYPKGHAYHHDTDDARTFLKDVIDYGMVAVALCWMGFLISVPAGIGWALGAVFYAISASYAHQLQHADADLVFWMPRPVHKLHHAVDMRDANFGIVVDWWDHVFGTYRAIEWPPKKRDRRPGLRDFTAIPWV